MPLTPRWTLLLATAALTVTTAAGCQGVTLDTGAPSSTTTKTTAAGAGDASAQLKKLVVGKKPAPRRGSGKPKK